MRNYLCTLLSFILFSQSLFSVLTHVRVIRSPNGRPIFFLGEQHDGLIGGKSDANQRCIGKLLEILREAENSHKGGYVVLVEATMENSEYFKNVLSLQCMCDYADEFYSSTIEDIEVRRTLAGAYNIFMCVSPTVISSYYSGSLKDRADAPMVRELYNKQYRCELDKITFQDIYDEVESRVIELNRLKEEWSCWWDNISLYGYTIFDVIGQAILQVECEFKRLKELVDLHANGPNEGVMDFGLRLLEKREEYVFFIRPGFERATLRVGRKIFNAFLIEKLYRLCQSDSQRPIVAIVGAGHASAVGGVLGLLGYTKLKHQCEVDQGPPAVNVALEPDVLNQIKEPLVNMASQNGVVTRISCNLL